MCLLSMTTLVLGTIVVLQRARVLFKTRVLLLHTHTSAWQDVMYVATIATVINSLLGTTLVPLIAVLVLEVSAAGAWLARFKSPLVTRGGGGRGRGFVEKVS